MATIEREETTLVTLTEGAAAKISKLMAEEPAGPRRGRRFRRRRLLRGRCAAEERGAAGRGRRDRPPADAARAGPARRRAGPREHQGRLARVREDRGAAGLPLLRQRPGRPG